MSKITNFFKEQLKYFFINRFWFTWPIIMIILFSLLTSGAVFYFYFANFKHTVGPIAIYYAGAVLILNLFLAAIVFPRQKFISYILLGAGLLIQIIILVFMKVASMTGGF